MAFVSLSMLELVHSLNIRSEKSIFKVGLFKNIYLIGAFIVGAILQISVVLIPSIAKIFDVVPLNKMQWIYTIGISILPIILVEIQKKINEMKFEKKAYKTKNEFWFSGKNIANAVGVDATSTRKP